MPFQQRFSIVLADSTIHVGRIDSCASCGEFGESNYIPNGRGNDFAAGTAPTLLTDGKAAVTVNSVTLPVVAGVDTGPFGMKGGYAANGPSSKFETNYFAMVDWNY